MIFFFFFFFDIQRILQRFYAAHVIAFAGRATCTPCPVSQAPEPRKGGSSNTHPQNPVPHPATWGQKGSFAVLPVLGVFLVLVMFVLAFDFMGGILFIFGFQCFCLVLLSFCSVIIDSWWIFLPVPHFPCFCGLFLILHLVFLKHVWLFLFYCLHIIHVCE